jgi:4-oxalocrotonate tautomerase
MPMITISGPVAEIECKRKLAEGLTRVAAEAYGLPADAIIVIIQENPQENVARGGVLLADRRAKS